MKSTEFDSQRSLKKTKIHNPYLSMLIGYARVSTQEQNPELQLDALTKAGCEKDHIYIDKISGATKQRPELDKLRSYIRKGDTLVVWRLDRLGRSLKDLIEWVEWMDENGIAFKSLTESIDTSTSGGKLIFSIFGAIAEFERNLIKERTKAGLAAARARGRLGGRPKKLDQKKIDLAKKLYASKEHTIQEICEAVGVSKATLYKYLQTSLSSERTDI